MPSPTKVAWLLRADARLKERLELIAKAEKRSLNNLIEYFLEYMADFYEKAPLYSVDLLLNSYHESPYWTRQYDRETQKDIHDKLELDRKNQERKLKEARKSG
jgi:hypothetical protein